MCEIPIGDSLFTSASFPLYKDSDAALTRSPLGRNIRNKAPQDQDTLAPINYDLIDPEVYFAAKGQRQLDYISSIGCFFRCTFCADPFVFKRRWTAISPERVVEEIAAFHARHAITDVNFQDETFFPYRNRCVAIAEGLVERLRKSQSPS